MPASATTRPHRTGGESVAERWLNRDAVEWVLYEADVDSERLPLLLAVASFTNVEGRGAYPARMLLALMTRRHKSTVIRGLAALVKRGLLLRGDWRRVAHIRADRRPNVYDLPDKYRTWLSRGGTVPPRRPPRGSNDDTNGVANEHQRGSTMPPEEFLKNSGRRADAQPSAASVAPKPQPLAVAGHLITAVRLLREHGHSGADAHLIVEYLARDQGWDEPMTPAEVLEDVQDMVSIAMSDEDGSLENLTLAQVWKAKTLTATPAENQS
jgi:hypothetical protein